MNALLRTFHTVSKCKFVHLGTLKDVNNKINKNYKPQLNLGSTALNSYEISCDNQQTRNFRFERNSISLTQRLKTVEDGSDVRKRICQNTNLNIVERSLNKVRRLMFNTT